MRKQQDASVHASALQVALALALGSILVTLAASTFAQRSGGNTRVQRASAYAFQSVNSSAPEAVLAGPVTITATAGNHGPTDYVNLRAALAAINAGTHQGDISIAIAGDTTETQPAILNASGSGSASYTSVLIQPSGGASRTISGAMSAGSPLVDLNGADNVTIDGLGTGGNSLTFSNTTVANSRGTSTLRFINGAQNNTITRCAVMGSANPASGSIAGNIVFGDTQVGSGNNSKNTVSFCNLGPAGTNLPTKAVTAFGLAGAANTGNLIHNNNIFDFFCSPSVFASGISILANNSDWTVSNNRIYQTAPRTFTTSAQRYAGITIDSSGGFFTVTGNIIGFGAANQTGTTTLSGTGNEVRGLDLVNVSTTTPTSVQGNFISGINQTSARRVTTAANSPFIAIALAAPQTGTGAGRFNVGDVTGNAIGSLDGSSTIIIAATSTLANTAPVLGILDSSSSSNTISNNDIGNITINSGVTGITTGFRAIYSNGTDPTQLETINDNTIANITDNIVGNYAMFGISSSLSAADAEGNVVHNISGNSNSSGITMTGIAVSAQVATQPTIVSQNTVYSLRNTATGATTAAVYGMDFTLSSLGGNLVAQNFVHSLSAASILPAYQIFGLVMEGQGAATFQNNMVQLGFDAAGNSITAGFSIAGIRDTAGATANYYFNSVHIGGTGVTSFGNTFAFFSDAVNCTHNFENNIFYNARSNISGSGANAAIEVGGSAANRSGLTTNYNDLYATGTGGVIGIFDSKVQSTLSDWQTATGQDDNSISDDPQYLNPNGNASNADLHVSGTSPCLSAGLAIAGITDDFDSDPRRNPPTIGVGEPFVIPSPTARPTPTSRHTPAPRPQPTPPPRPSPGTDSGGSAKISTQPRSLASPAGAKKK